MKKKLDNCINKNRKIFVFILCFLLFMFFIKDITKLKGIVVINDEFGYWGIAAHLAGFEWSGLLPTIPYYAYGYSLLLVPFFWLGISATAMYQLAIILNVILVVFSFILSIKCAKRLLPHISENFIILVSFVVALYTNNIIQAQLAWAETLLYFLYWLLLYFFIQNIYRPSIKNICGGVITAVYMYSVHQRTIGIILVYFVLIVIWAIINRWKTSWFLLFSAIFVILMVSVSLMKGNMIDAVFTNNELVAMNDYSGQTGKIQSILFTFTGFAKFLESIAGKLYYTGASTMLMGFLGLGFLIKNMLCFFKVLIKSKFRKLEAGSYTLLFVTGTFAAIFVINAIAMYSNYGRLDLLIYGRYMESCFGPIILLGIVELFKNKQSKGKVVWATSILLILSFVANRGLIGAGTDLFNGFCSTTLYYFFKNKLEVPNLAFTIAVFMCLPAIIIVSVKSLFERKRKIVEWNLGGMALFILIWVYLSNVSGPIEQQKYIEKTVAPIVQKVQMTSGVEHLYFVQSETMDEIDLESNIYIKYIQFYLPGLTIERIDSKQLEELSSVENCLFIQDVSSKALSDKENEYFIVEQTDIFLLLSKERI